MHGAGPIRSKLRLPLQVCSVPPMVSWKPPKVPSMWLIASPLSIGCVQVFWPTPAVEVNFAVTLTSSPCGDPLTV